MRFSISLSHGDWARVQTRQPGARDAIERTVALARAADSAGAHAVWVTEDPDGWDAAAILAALARETTRVRLGTGVMNPLMRHPNLIAMSVATVDLLSGRRAFLGLGRGEPDWYRAGLGMRTPASPLAAMERTVALLRQWWTPPHRVEMSELVTQEDPVSNAAVDPFPVRNWERTVHPVGAAHDGEGPPIVLAAAGPKALALAGRVADGVLINDLASDTYLRWAVGIVRDSARSAGRNPDALTLCYGTTVSVNDDPEQELARRRTQLAMINALPGMNRQLDEPGFDTAGMIAEIRQLLRSDELRARGGGFPEIKRFGDLRAAAEVVPVELIDRLSVIGPAAHVRARLTTLREIGIDEVFVALPPRHQAADVLGERIRMLRALSDG